MRMLEAEKKVTEAMVQLEAEKKLMASKMAEAYRSVQRRREMNVDEEESVADMISDRGLGQLTPNLLSFYFTLNKCRDI